MCRYREQASGYQLGEKSGEEQGRGRELRDTNDCIQNRFITGIYCTTQSKQYFIKKY